MRTSEILAVVLLVAAIAIAGCVGPAVTPGETTSVASQAPNASRVLTIMTHDSFSVSEDVVAQFQLQCNCEVRFLQSGDTGLALNKVILAAGNPLADVFFGVDNTLLSRALAADIFEPYESPMLATIPDELKLDPSHRLLPVDVGYVTLNYDKSFFSEGGLPLPDSLLALTDPSYRGLLVVENPATSSPGLAFLLATIEHFGESGSYTYLDFWRDLRANEVLVADGWETAYYTHFSGSSGEGERPLVVSYATSPAAEVYFADPAPDASPTGSLNLAGGSYWQVEFVGVLRGTKAPDLAHAWIDFMLGPEFQADIPLQMWVYPAREKVALPEVFARFTAVPESVVSMSPEQIEAGRERWLVEWTDAVLR